MLGQGATSVSGERFFRGVLFCNGVQFMVMFVVYLVLLNVVCFLESVCVCVLPSATFQKFV